MSKKRTKIFISSSVLALSLMVVSPTLAATSTVKSSITSGAETLKYSLKAPFARSMHPGIAGPVTAINGTSLTITGKNDTSYVVDASGAVVMKEGATSTLSSINVGDFIFVKGTVASTTVTATTIFDSVNAQKISNSAHARKGKISSSLNRVSFGTISSVNGADFDLATHSKTGTTTFAVTTDSSTIFKENGATSTSAVLSIGGHALVIGEKSTTTDSISNVKEVNVLTGTVAPHTGRKTHTTTS